MGGDDNLDTRVTLPNIIKKFNPQLFGQSYNIGPTNVWDVAYLNAGIPGDVAGDLPGQAQDLVTRLQSHPDKIDMENDWKLVSLFIGSNDACHYCQDNVTYSAANFSSNVRQAIKILYDNVPRVLVNIIGSLHVEIARQVDATDALCKTAHTLVECQCEYDHNVSDADFASIVYQYQQAAYDIMMSGEFERPDFSVVVQPFYNNTVQPPLNPDGTPNLSLFAPDCFHFRGLLHSAVARILWNSMLVPVGQKPQQFNFTNLMLPLNCPDTACPYFRTTKNSVQCSQFWTAPLV
uniref:Phospholipase B1, membrane-associated n=1 Tax=Plectus sambesii TaxID=2011161 RepID=A0A914W4X5_9BILA